MKKLTLARILQLECELEIIDQEIDDILKTYYLADGAQNIGGNIGALSKWHAELVELLAEKKRELMGGGGRGGAAHGTI